MGSRKVLDASEELLTPAGELSERCPPLLRDSGGGAGAEEKLVELRLCLVRGRRLAAFPDSPNEAVSPGWALVLMSLLGEDLGGDLDLPLALGSSWRRTACACSFGRSAGRFNICTGICFLGCGGRALFGFKLLTLGLG